jgi:RNA polymerase sigma factor (sigma-70 family)
MGDKFLRRPDANCVINLACPFAGNPSLLDAFYAQSGAGDWGLSRKDFTAALERSVQKRFSQGTLTWQELEKYLATLYLEDLALCCACAEGSQTAWDYFVAAYRTYLRAAAAAILRGGSHAADPQELADSLFAELYGLGGSKPAGRSLLLYFHGRSSLKTWLRAVLAQKHIDAIRAARRFASLPEEDGDPGKRAAHEVTPPPGDPHRGRYVALFTAALKSALGQLDFQDKERLRLYYAEQCTLAETGKRLGEHESSVSRNLERVRGLLRLKVEQILRSGSDARDGSEKSTRLSAAELALCFEYAAADAPIDLDKLFPSKDGHARKAGRQKP